MSNENVNISTEEKTTVVINGSPMKREVIQNANSATDVTPQMKKAKRLFPWQKAFLPGFVS